MEKQENKQITRIESYEFDERFYQKIVNGKKVFAPSVTFILGSTYPSDFGLIQWRGDVGNKRADEILDETAEDGSFAHDAIHRIINGEKVSGKEIEIKFSPKRSLKIKRCLQAFLDWCKEYGPEFVQSEYIVWNEKDNYAGTVDCYCIIDRLPYLVDFKTSKSIHAQHKVQISAYKEADTRPGKPAILHLGNTTKKRYSWLVVGPEDQAAYWDQFQKANALFKSINPDAKPTDEIFPEFFERIKNK